MAEEEESFENLDDLDWSDVENELKANRDQILSEATDDGAGGGGADAGGGGAGAGGAGGAGGDAADGANPDTTSVAFKLGNQGGDIDIGFLFDVQLTIVVEVGRTQMLISDLLDLDKNSILELKSMVGQPLNIRANDMLVARGEVVVINEKFAVRITDIISPHDRFAAL